MPETTRTFVAIAIPEPLGRKLARLQQELSPEIPKCRWTSSSPFHATIAFLGDVQNRDLNDVVKTVAFKAAAFEPFELNLEGVGAFPDPRNPRVIWAGLTSPGPQHLLNLREQVVQALAEIGYQADAKFHPHVTLGRMKSDRRGAPELAAPLERRRSWNGGAFTVVQIVTFASTLGQAGPSYDALGHAPLLGGKTGDNA
jgi:2'-5' RNA ligase